MEKFNKEQGIVSKAAMHKGQTADKLTAIFYVHPKIQQVTANRISMLSGLPVDTIFDNVTKLCDALYQEGYIILNTNFDWKVSRGINEVSRTNGFKNFADFVNNRTRFLESMGIKDKVTIRDLGPGDGNFICQLQNKFQDEKYEIYGVGDKIYIDLYTSIKDSYFGKIIPENVLKLFVKKFLDARLSLEIEQDTLTSMLSKVLQNIELSESDILFQDSMFSEETTMFSRKDSFGLDEESKKFLRNPSSKKIIEELQNSIIKLILGDIDNGLKKIFISDFQTFRQNTIYSDGATEINKSHIQFATRSTSHMKNKDYFKFLDDYVKYLGENGSVFVDNGVQMSYTMITRLEELRQLKEKHGNTINIRLVYNENFNSFASAIIEKIPFADKRSFESELAPGFRLVELDEAVEDLSFQIDYIVRSYIGDILSEIYNDYVIFAEINNEINQLVENCCKNYVHLDYVKNNILFVLEKIFHIFINFIDSASRKNTLESISLMKKYHKARKKATGGLTSVCEQIYVCDGKDVFTTSIAKNSLNTLRPKVLQEKLTELSIETENMLENITTRIENNVGDIESNNRKDSFEEKNMKSYIMPLLEILNKEENLSEDVKNLTEIVMKEFIIPNPIVEKKESIDEKEAKEAKIKFWQDANILIVEDQTTISRIVKGGLVKKLGCKKSNIDIASDGVNAIEMIRLNPDKFDFVLMDIQMPNKNGKEATKFIRQKLNNPVKIIGFTAEDTTREELVAIGFDDYLPKPCPIETLRDKIENEVCKDVILERYINYKD